MLKKLITFSVLFLSIFAQAKDNNDKKSIKCSSYFQTKIHETDSEILRWHDFASFSLSRQEELLKQRHKRFVEELLLIRKLIKKKRIQKAASKLSTLTKREIAPDLISNDSLENLVDSIKYEKKLMENVKNEYSRFNLVLQSRYPIGEEINLFQENEIEHTLLLEMENKVTKSTIKYQDFLSKDQLSLEEQKNKKIGILESDISQYNVSHQSLGQIKKIIIFCHYQTETLSETAKIMKIKSQIKKLQKKVNDLSKRRDQKVKSIIISPDKEEGLQNHNYNQQSGSRSQSR